MSSGWIKLHRQLQDCPIWYGERFSKGQAWVDLLMLANHSDKDILFNGEIVTIKRGQYLTSMVKLSEKWLWNRKTVLSFLNLLEKDKMIVRKSDNKKTLITIENYEIYQSKDDDVGQQNGQLNIQQTGQQMDNRLDSRTDTNKNDKNEEECKNDIKLKNPNKEIIERIIEYLNQKCGTHYRPSSKETVQHINARLKEGYAEDDFYIVIDKKADEWIGTKQEEYLRPITLFSTKFESYLNQKINKQGYNSQTAQMLNESYNMMNEWVRQKESEGCYDSKGICQSDGGD